MIHNRKILVIIGGGIAAYKVLELIRLLRKAGNEVIPVLTEAGEHFVTPLSVAALAGSKVSRELLDPASEGEMGHIALSRQADLVLVAPATADLIARMAGGLANDLATTLLLATDTPVVIAPAMNVRMWDHPATRRNLETLKTDGIRVISPGEGEMACGEFGVGRMAEPEDIMQELARLTACAPGSLRVIVTSGPTREAIDPVRYIANRSSGKQGSSIAEAFARSGAEVVFITGPASAPPPSGVRIVRVESADQMLAAVQEAMPVDVAVCAAAVADWKVVGSKDRKISKMPDGKAPELELVANPDILATISASCDRPELVIGFAAETGDVVQKATRKRERKGCDWIVANDVSPESGVFGGDENEVCLIDEDGFARWPRMSKRQVAERLVLRVHEDLQS